MSARSSGSTFVELFHAGLLFSNSSFLEDGEDSGVMLWLCLWEGVVGVAA